MREYFIPPEPYKDHLVDSFVCMAHAQREALVTQAIKENPWYEYAIKICLEPGTFGNQKVVKAIPISKKSFWSYLKNKYRLWRYKGIAPWAT